MPAAVAARPRDERGYPASAVTPWSDGVPAFASQSPLRTFVCAAQHRCAVCGTKMPPGPVYHLVEGEIAGFIAYTSERGKSFRDYVRGREGPGHRACMVYAAAVCPYLASPNEHRKIAGRAGPETVSRGPSSAVVGFDGYSWHFDGKTMEVTYGQPVELLPYAGGGDLVAELRAEIARERGPAGPCPAYLLDDNDSVYRVALALPADGSSRNVPACRQDQVLKARRKAARAARRNNR